MNGKEIEIREGDSLIIYPDIPHEYYAENGKMLVSWIAFDGFQVKSMIKSFGINRSGIYRFIDNNEIHNSIKDVLPLQDIPLTEQCYRGSELVYNFLLTLMKNSRSDESEQKDFTISKIKPAIDFMNKNLGLSIGIEEIAGSIDITPQHFCLIFKSVMNQRPFEYLNSLRINYSKKLLLENRAYTIKKVSELSGYPSQSYFCQIFKRIERITPAEFRKLY